MGNETIFPIWQCYFFEPPDNISEEFVFVPANYSDNSANDLTTAIRCILKSEYLVGKYYGPTTCVILGAIIILIGIIGAVGNATNVVVLKFLTKNSSMYYLLILLAVFDLIVCCFAIPLTIFLQVIVNGISREKSMLRAVQVSIALFSLGRSGSAYMTILVTLERLLVVTYPLHFKSWVTKCRGLFIVAIWILIILLINCSWWLNVTLEENLYAAKFPGTDLAKFPYLITETWYSKNIYSKIQPWDTFVDIFLPVPLLLILNGLLCYQIYKANKNREKLTRTQFREINTARMFSKVATILFICNSCGIAHLVITQSTGIFYHELMHFISISTTANSCINFFIYYATSKYFKGKLKKLLGSKAMTVSGSGSGSS